MHKKSVAWSVDNSERVVKQVVLPGVGNLVNYSLTINNIFVHIVDGRYEGVICLLGGLPYITILILDSIVHKLEVLAIVANETSCTEHTSNWYLVPIP
jgi:hypothetical protein